MGAAFGAVLLTAACSASGLSAQTAFLGPAERIEVSHEAADVDPLGRQYRLGAPYEAAEQVIPPARDPEYQAVGVASWYGPRFHGRRTANGEIFDATELSAAHPTLPLPSYVRVTNLANQRSVLVRINDRGPFSKRRVIDVSQRTAELLGFKRAGVAEVEVQFVGMARRDIDDSGFLAASYTEPGRGSDPASAQAAFAAATPAVAAAGVTPVALAAGAPLDLQAAALRPVPAGQTGPAALPRPRRSPLDAWGATYRTSYATAADDRIASVFAVLEAPAAGQGESDGLIPAPADL